MTTMARNGSRFGIRLSGTGDRWFTGPAGIVDGLYLPGYGAEDANPDIGDSTITETVGLGGFAMAAAPAIVEFVGGRPEDALATTEEMYGITWAESSAYRVPALGFRGTPTGIDCREVVHTGCCRPSTRGSRTAIRGSARSGPDWWSPRWRRSSPRSRGLADGAGGRRVTTCSTGPARWVSGAVLDLVAAGPVAGTRYRAVRGDPARRGGGRVRDRVLPPGVPRMPNGLSIHGGVAGSARGRGRRSGPRDSRRYAGRRPGDRVESRSAPALGRDGAEMDRGCERGRLGERAGQILEAFAGIDGFADDDRHARDGVASLLAAVRSGDPRAAGRAGRELTGRGPGLTPLGDDVLAATALTVGSVGDRTERPPPGSGPGSRLSCRPACASGRPRSRRRCSSSPSAASRWAPCGALRSGSASRPSSSR